MRRGGRALGPKIRSEFKFCPHLHSCKILDSSHVSCSVEYLPKRPILGRKKGNREVDIGCRFGGRKFKAFPVDGFHFLSERDTRYL